MKLTSLARLRFAPPLPFGRDTKAPSLPKLGVQLISRSVRRLNEWRVMPFFDARLISTFTFDRVYRIYIKDQTLYFIRIGGQAGFSQGLAAGGARGGGIVGAIIGGLLAGWWRSRE